MDKLLRNLIFIDIETVSGTKEYTSLSTRLQEAWKKKSTILDPENSDYGYTYFDRAAIYAEFGKIIVIGVGFFHENENKELALRVKSIASDNEKQLLKNFCQLIEKGFVPSNVSLCAHNGKEFDFPYLCRRMLINNIVLPEYLSISGKKPWEIRHYDTMEMWKFGDRKNYTSLELLAAAFDLKTSKESIDGSKVNSTYYNEDRLDLISDYCQRDVAVLAQLFLKLNSIQLPAPENILFV
jgi:predicted PolB exonuclease-like 3'-5' exonuclease